MKIGAITVGQSPRIDVTADIMDILGGQVELMEAGGLDGLSRDEIAGFTPREGDYVLVSRMNDGSSVTFAEKHVLPRLQEAVNRMEEEGCRIIMMFCTGTFPEELCAKHIPLIYPCEILNRMVPLLTGKSSIVCVVPSALQVEQSEEKWSRYVEKVTAIPASPYKDWESLEQAAEQAAGTDADLILLDCIGYSQKMKKMFAEKTGKPVILPRTLLARVVAELV